MRPFFNNPEILARLQYHAGLWIGTPFMPHAQVRGSGVCCQKLVGALYSEVGFLPPEFKIPTGPMDWSHANKRSLIADFMATQTEKFSDESIPWHIARVFAPGDMIGFHVGGCVHHCGVIVSTDGQFIHCLRERGTVWSNIKDATYLSRVEKLWRPVAASLASAAIQS